MRDLLARILSFYGVTSLGAITPTQLFATVVGLVAAMAFIWGLVQILLLPLKVFFRQPAKKKLFKAAETLDKSADAASRKMTAYRLALQALIDQYRVDKTKLAQTVEALDLATTALNLPEIDPAKFVNLKTFCRIHDDTEPYYRAFYNAAILSGMCNLYREFLANDNKHHLDAVKTLISGLYHSTPLKAHAEYVANKTPDHEADQAMSYFTAYAKLIDGALDHVVALRADLDAIKRENRRYSKLVTAWVD